MRVRCICQSPQQCGTTLPCMCCTHGHCIMRDSGVWNYIARVLIIIPNGHPTSAVVQQVRHGLLTNRAVSLFGSSIIGNCTSSVMGEGAYCNGTSVLNDGVTPVLSGVSNDTNSTWAEPLFTTVRPGTSRILISFELEDATHDRVEFSEFN